MNIGAAIRVCRAQRGITQKELSVKAGVSTSYISHLERNEKDPTLSTLKSIARALNVPLPIFFFLAADEETDALGTDLRDRLSSVVLRLIKQDD